MPERILIFPFPLLAHYWRCLELADRIEGKSEILFADHPKYGQLARDAGYKTFKCEGFDEDIVMDHIRRFDFSWLNAGEIERVYRNWVRVIEREKPDLVIGDVAPPLKMAAERTGVRFVSLTNAYMNEHYQPVRKLSRTHKAYAYSQKLPEPLFDKITQFAERAAFRKVHKPFRRIRSRDGLSYVGSYLGEFVGDRTLICDDPLLFPLNGIDKRTTVIGPLIRKVQQSDPVRNELDDTRPTITVCMGSTGDWTKLRFLESAHLDGYNILAAGKGSEVINNDRMIRRDFMDLDEVLPSSDLLICHGGNGTIYKGLQHQVMMLCMTSHFEQEWNVHQLERVGAGLSIDGLEEDEILTRIASAKKPAGIRIDAGGESVRL